MNPPEKLFCNLYSVGPTRGFLRKSLVQPARADRAVKGYQQVVFQFGRIETIYFILRSLNRFVTGII